MSSYPSSDTYTEPQSALSGNGDVDVETFPLPPNVRSMSMTMSEQPIVDPDFGWFDTYPPAAQFTEFGSSPSSSGSSASAGYDWYDPLPPPAAPHVPASVPYPADGAHPHPAHPHNGSSVPQPAHGLTPIIPPQQRAVPPQQPNYARKADFSQQPPYPQPHPRQQQQQQQQHQQHQPPQQQHSAIYDQPPPYQHAASFPPPSYPPQHPPSEQQQQLTHLFNQHARRASTPAHSSTLYSTYSAGTTPGAYSGGTQAMYSAGDHSPVSHISSVSSLSSHSSSSSENGLEVVRHKRKQSNDSNAAAELNGVEHSPTETASTAKGGKGKGGASKKQKANNATNTKAKPNARTASVPTVTTAAAAKGKGSDSSHSTPPTASPAAKPAVPNNNVYPDNWIPCSFGGPAGPAMTSVARTADKGKDVLNVAWPMQYSTYNSMQQYFVSLILAIKQPDAPTITDIIHLIAHAMEVAPAPSMTFLLRRLGYVPQPVAAESNDDADCRRVVWRSPNPFLPYMTLPHHFRLNWSVSPETTQPEDTTVINFPTLCWWRAKENRFVRRSDGSVQAFETSFHPGTHAGSSQRPPADSPLSSTDSTAATPTPQTPATPSTEPASPSDPTAASSLPSLPPGEIDMSVLDLPCHVEVNSAFERMFGYSQSEIRILFIRHGKQGLARLADAQQFRQCHELSMRDACEGQQEFSHVIDVRPKYGGTMKTVMHQKLVVGNEGLVWKKLYMWIPLTKAMKEAYVASQQAAGVAAPTFCGEKVAGPTESKDASKVASKVEHNATMK